MNTAAVMSRNELALIINGKLNWHSPGTESLQLLNDELIDAVLETEFDYDTILSLFNSKLNWLPTSGAIMKQLNIELANEVVEYGSKMMVLAPDLVDWK